MAVEPPFRIKNMMPGMIMLWYGSVATIPSGWHLCDGAAGTPDLRDAFVCGAGLTYAPAAVGGTPTHVHAFTGDGHAHDHGVGEYIANSAPAGNYEHISTTMPASGTTDSGSSIPPFMALCYIMKLPIP